MDSPRTAPKDWRDPTSYDDMYKARPGRTNFQIQDNGFEVDVYEEKPDWRRRQLALYERIVAEQAALIEEMGEGIRTLVAEAEELLADGLANARADF